MYIISSLNWKSRNKSIRDKNWDKNSMRGRRHTQACDKK